MASRFPGMDPYIKHFWRDVHGFDTTIESRPLPGDIVEEYISNGLSSLIPSGIISVWPDLCLLGIVSDV